MGPEEKTKAADSLADELVQMGMKSKEAAEGVIILCKNLLCRNLLQASPAEELAVKLMAVQAVLDAQWGLIPENPEKPEGFSRKPV